MRKRSSTTALAAAVVTVVMVSGVAGCDGGDEGSTALSSEVQELVDEYAQTWNDNDGDAFLALVTDDYRFVSLIQDQDAEAMAADISAGQYSSTIGQVGDGIMTGDGPYYYGSIVNELVGPEDDDRITGISTFVVLDDGGVLKIAQHAYTGQFGS